MRHSHFLSGSALTSLALLLVTSSVVTAEVWVITDSRHPVTGAHAADRVIELDAAQRLEAELSAQLPADPKQATALVQQRLQQGGQALQQRLHTAHQGVTDAWSLGITTVPAVVVNQRYVVYGVNDISQALARVASYQQEQQP